MTTTPTSPERPTRRKAWVFVFSGLLVALTAVGVVAFVRQRARVGRAEIDRRLEAIRTAGEPVTAADLRRRYPTPAPEHDALRLLAVALDRLSVPDRSDDLPFLGQTALPAPPNSLGPELRDRLVALAQTNHDAVEAANAVQLHGTWLGFDLKDDFSLPSARHVKPLRDLSHVLLLTAVVEAEQGQANAAVKHLLQGLSVGQCFRSGILSHHLTRRIVEQRTCDVLERVINRTELAEPTLAGLDQLLAQEHVEGIREAMFDIRCLNIWQLEQIRADPVGSLVMQDFTDAGWFASLKARMTARLVAWSRHGYRDQDFTLILDSWDKVFAALNQIPRQRRAALEGVSDVAARENQRRSVVWAVCSPAGYLRRIDQDLEIIARLRTARVALAILRWRAAHEGKLPESLAELVPDMLPAIPEDPFDEQSLRYRRLPQGFTIYSVGPDFTDNGGQRPPAGTEKSDGYDVVFAVERFPVVAP